MNELKRLFPYIAKYKVSLILGFIFISIANILETIVPRIIGSTIDLISSGQFSNTQIINNILKFLGLTAGSGILLFFTRKTIIVSSRKIEYDLRRDYLNAIQYQPISFFHQNPTGNLMAYATNDIVAAREFLGPAIMYSANTITVVIFAMYFMFSLNPSITLFVLIPLPLIAIFTYIISKRIYSTYKKVQDKFADLTSFAQESFSGLRIIKSYVRETYESKLFSEHSEDYLSKNLKHSRIQSLTMPAFMLLVGGSILIVLGYGGKQVIERQATIGDLSQFFIYISLLIWPVAAIGWVTNIIQRAAASAGRLGKVFDAFNEENFAKKNNINFEKNYGKIEFQNIGMTYNNFTALKNISFKISPGESLGIVGSIGSGKTSVINLITKLFDRNLGKLLIDDIDINEIPLDKLRKSLGVVPQEPFLFSDTIAENIRFGMPDASIVEIINVAKITMLHDEIIEFPDKYNTLLGERGITLSGGQKQRLALARALLLNPSVLILDDATSSIDTQTEEKILFNLKNYLSDKTVIIISHRISTVKNCTHIIFLYKGEIIERGTHAELISLRGRYFDIYSRQALEAELDVL